MYIRIRVSAATRGLRTFAKEVLPLSSVDEKIHHSKKTMRVRAGLSYADVLRIPPTVVIMDVELDRIYWRYLSKLGFRLNSDSTVEKFYVRT